MEDLKGGILLLSFSLLIFFLFASSIDKMYFIIFQNVRTLRTLMHFFSAKV